MKRLLIFYLILPGLILIHCGVFEPKENKPREGIWNGNTYDRAVIQFEVSGERIHFFTLDQYQFFNIDASSADQIFSEINNNHFEIDLKGDFSDFSYKIIGEFTSQLYSEGQIDFTSDSTGEHWSIEWKAVSEHISDVLPLNTNQVFKGITKTSNSGAMISDDDDDDWQYDAYWPYGEPIYQKKPQQTKAQLGGAYPNPSSTYIFFLYSLFQESDVYLAIINNNYQTIKILTDQKYQPGFYSVTWDLKDRFERRVPGNIYRCVFKAGDYRSHGDVWVR